MYMYYTNMYLHVMQYCLNWDPIHVQFGTNLSCKHLLKYLNPPSTLPTSSKTITRVKMSNVKTSKGALIIGFHMFNMFVRLYAHEAKLLTQVLKLTVTIDQSQGTPCQELVNRNEYWKQCLQAPLLNRSLPKPPHPRFLHNFFRTAFPTNLESGTGFLYCYSGMWTADVIFNI